MIAFAGAGADAASGVGTNGGGSLMGESPQAGWEGESELGFPLDDVPKDVPEPSDQGVLRNQRPLHSGVHAWHKAKLVVTRKGFALIQRARKMGMSAGSL